MKAKNFLSGIMVLGLIFSFCIGCNRPGEVEYSTKVIVLKFKKPEYKNYILANYHEGADYISAARGNRCEAPTGEAGYSPYWELPDNWLLVDWKWYNFPYDAGLTLLTEQPWEKFNGGIHPPFPQWPLSEPHIFQPVEKIYYIKLDNLEKYSNASYSAEMKWYIYCTNNETDIIHLSDITKCLCEMSDTMDSIWSVLQRDLSVAIENGDLEHINDRK